MAATWDIARSIFSIHDQIIRAISSGAGWEVWLQVEFFHLALQSGLSAVREERYLNTDQFIDLLASARDHRYAIELKVESASKIQRVPPVDRQVVADINKLRTFDFRHQNLPVHRIAVGVAYSVAGRQGLRNLAAQYNGSFYDHGNLTVIIVRV